MLPTRPATQLRNASPGRSVHRTSRPGKATAARIDAAPTLHRLCNCTETTRKPLGASMLIAAAMQHEGASDEVMQCLPSRRQGLSEIGQ